jgi:epoxyqueuosine reductase
MSIDSASIKQMARECGFELVGIAAAEPSADFERFDSWRERGMAGEMTYLTDHRGDLRKDPRNLLPSARSVVCVGKLYNTYSDRENSDEESGDSGMGRISRYAWGADYHDVVKAGLEELVSKIQASSTEPFSAKTCVDTAPLLERSLAHQAGLGWIGKNTCLIKQGFGSWFFLGEVLLSIPLEIDLPAPNRCGSCTRCIDACPTQAIVPNVDGSWAIDSRLCISYLTIEKRGELPESTARKTGNHLFGCDICQDVCPWNTKAPLSTEPAFEPLVSGAKLAELATLSEDEFRRLFRNSPIWRSKYQGFLRNVAIAMGNSGTQDMQIPLQKLSRHADAVVSGTASAALERLNTQLMAAL